MYPLVYAPTASAPPAVAQRFMDDLHDTLDGIQQSQGRIQDSEKGGVATQ